MKRQPVYISFLDLVFSLLGSVTILTVILAITAGRAEHRLERDYVRITVVWERANGSYLATIAGAGPPRGPEDGGGWSFQAHPVKGGADEPVSVYFLSPAAAGQWRVRWDAGVPTAARVVVETKRESFTLPALPPTRELTVETR